MRTKGGAGVHVLVLKHVEAEGPGMLGEFFEEKGVETGELRLYEGDPLPEDPSGAGAVVVMGGPMNVYEEDRYPFLKEEDGFLKEALRCGVPVLGVCLGAQLLAKACGAEVKRAVLDEVGWGTVRVTPDGAKDPLLTGLGGEFEVFQWHEDTFEIPAGGVLLAESGLCRNQAFRVGPNAYGLQFHMEVTCGMLSNWYRDCPEKERALGRLEEIEGEFRRRARLLCMNFLGLAMLSREGAGGEARPA